MQRLPSAFAAIISIFTLTTMPACKDKQEEGGAEADGAKAAGEADGAEGEPAEAGPAEAGAAEAGVGAAEAGAAEAGAGEAGGIEAAEAGAAEAGAAEAGAVVVEEDPVPALLEQAKSLDTDDGAAKKALDDAVAAGAAKLDVAKVANGRGEALMAKGEAERAEGFFVWARDAHTLYADPVYNLATLAAYAGDLEIAKEHLQELEKRGNKKLMKKVGVDPAFAPLHDDPDVRKIYEKK